MTLAEKEEARREWLSTVIVGDEVCISNLDNISFTSLFGDVMGSENNSPKICIINRIRGILSDGSYVVGNYLFDNEGKLIVNSGNNQIDIPKLCEPTDELRSIAWREEFKRDIKKFDWDKLDDETLNTIIDLINTSVKKKELEEVIAKREAEAKAEEEQSEFKYEDENDNLSSDILAHDETGVNVAANKYGMRIPEEEVIYPPIDKDIIERITKLENIVLKLVGDNDGREEE